jgi:hypothetical protein
MAITHDIMRRGLEAASESFTKPKPDDGNGKEKPINPVALLIIALTFIFFAIVLVAVSAPCRLMCA